MIYIVPTLEDNYSYVVAYHGTALVIDCGEAGPVIDFLNAQYLKPKIILCTHHHWDHIDGLNDFKSVYPDTQILAPQKDLNRIAAAKDGLTDNQVISFGPYHFKAIETPGHTANHLCYYCKELSALFSGDTLFSCGCGRLFEGTPEEMFQSLQALKSLPPDTLIYGGHEYSEKNAEFCLTIEPNNPALKQHLGKIRNLIKTEKPTFPVSLESELETNVFLKAKTAGEFARLRELRNNF